MDQCPSKSRHIYLLQVTVISDNDLLRRVTGRSDHLPTIDQTDPVKKFSYAWNVPTDLIFAYDESLKSLYFAFSFS